MEDNAYPVETVQHIVNKELTLDGTLREEKISFALPVLGVGFVRPFVLGGY